MRAFVLLLILTACGMTANAITMEEFQGVEVSSPKEKMIAVLGNPYSTVDKGDGYIEYEYIERIKIGARNIEERHYFFLVKDGVVVSKRVTQSIPLPYGFDSYEMQTTQQ